MQIAAVLFFIGVAIVLYTYVGYPLALLVIGAIKRRRVRRGAIEPSISIIIPAHNEATVIAETVLNKLACDYPAERQEILVVSDGSSDGTDERVQSLGNPDVRLIRQEPRQGKTAALNRAVKLAKGEIIVFSDANSLYSTDVLRHLAANFADPSVGYVTGKLTYANPDRSGVAESCGAYMKYENFVRALENRCGSIIGVNGGIDAMRKSLYVEMPPDVLPDFVLPLSVVQKGYRVVFEPLAVLTENALTSSGEEFQMRVRVTLRSLHAMWHMKRMFNPFRRGFFAFQLFSHKLLRYSVPFLLIALFALNAIMAGRGGFWLWAFLAQCLFYAAAVLGGFLLRVRRRLPTVVHFPFYFVLINWASLVAWLKFLRGKKQVVWVPRTG